MDKGKLLRIERSLPHEVRITPEMYPVHEAHMRQKGVNPFTWDELGQMYPDRSRLHLVVKQGVVRFFYENRIYEFWFLPGFVHNTASVPGFLKWAKDNDDLDMYTMALPHDGGYMTHLIDKDTIDQLFVDGIEYYNEQVEESGFFAGLLEDFAENATETAIEIAFGTDAAQEAWESSPEIIEKGSLLMRVNITQNGRAAQAVPAPRELVAPAPAPEPEKKAKKKKATKKAAKKKVSKKSKS
jgi:hypothetical protein